MTIKILIADDHEVVRVGLRAFLAKSNIRIVAEAPNGNIAYKLAKKHRPDLLLLDVRMPDGDGLDCLARVKRDLPAVAVVMFSSFDNPTYVARSLALGAAGYLSKSESRDRIIHAIQVAAQGDKTWSKEELRRVSGGLASSATASDGNQQLTKREGEVLKQLAFGLTNKEIAQGLGISYETVKEHVQHILQKLAVTDRTQAAVWVVPKKARLGAVPS